VWRVVKLYWEDDMFGIEDDKISVALIYENSKFKHDGKLYFVTKDTKTWPVSVLDLL